MLLTAFHGFCMALADSVPGVSGGTIAFILGFYDRFINALHNLLGDRRQRRNALAYLLNLGGGWLLGLTASVLALARLFAANIYLMSSVFLGLTVASLPLIVSGERDALRGQARNLPLTVLGAALVVALTMLRGHVSLGTLDFLRLSVPQLAYIFASGMVAIAAMVLPGISGSSVLLIMGVYLPAIGAMRQALGLELAALPGLVALGCGILVGVVVSIGAIREALNQHRSRMVHLILGLLLGSLAAIVNGPATLATPLPPLTWSTFSPGGFALGVALLCGLELLRRRVSA